MEQNKFSCAEKMGDADWVGGVDQVSADSVWGTKAAQRWSMTCQGADLGMLLRPELAGKNLQGMDAIPSSQVDFNDNFT